MNLFFIFIIVNSCLFMFQSFFEGILKSCKKQTEVTIGSAVVYIFILPTSAYILIFKYIYKIIGVLISYCISYFLLAIYFLYVYFRIDFNELI